MSREWLEDNMVRLLKVVVLWCLFSVAGFIAVGLGAWILMAVGVNSQASEGGSFWPSVF
jgi:hypothetical protein